jgi:hypothetical protein
MSKTEFISSAQKHTQDGISGRDANFKDNKKGRRDSEGRASRQSLHVAMRGT